MNTIKMLEELAEGKALVSVEWNNTYSYSHDVKWIVHVARTLDGTKLEVIECHEELDQAIENCYNKFFAAARGGITALLPTAPPEKPFTDVELVPLDDEIPF